MAWLARIALSEGEAIVLRPDFKWQVEKDRSGRARLVARLANISTHQMGYHPADGYPGRLVGNRIAKALGLKAEFPPMVEPDDPNAVY